MRLACPQVNVCHPRERERKTMPLHLAGGNPFGGALNFGVKGIVVAGLILVIGAAIYIVISWFKNGKFR